MSRGAKAGGEVTGEAERVRRLEEDVRRHRQLYYNEEPEITDEAFDALVDELETLAPASPVLAEVGAPIEVEGVGLPTKAHRIPMGSLEKILPERLEFWASKAGPTFLVQEKLDGISLELEYEGGRLVDAITRGDGFVGEVVTHNAVHFKNVRRTLPGRFSGSLRGEVILRLSVFAEEFAGRGFANPRNTVSGTSRKKHGDRSAARHFEICFFDVLSPDVSFETETEKISFIRDDLGLKIATSFFEQDLEGIRRIYARYAGDAESGESGESGEGGLRRELDYEIDGLVLRTDSLARQAELGVVGNRPRFAVAYKFLSEGKPTTLRDVGWSLGLGGRVTPVARLEPVQVSGVTVSNATLHNLAYVRALGLRIGDRVIVERKGDVIPQVTKVLARGDGATPTPPKKCPACGQPVEIDEKFVRCVNPQCPGRIYGDLKKWVDELEIDSIGEKWLELFGEHGLVTDPADFYRLRVEDLLPLERMGKVLAEKMVRNIEESRRVPLDRFLAGLNVAEFSRQRAQMLIDAGYDTLDAILALEADDIAAVKGFAEKLAEKVHSGLAARRERIERLLAGGVEVVSPPRTAADAAAGGGPFAGKTVCFTGAVGEENPATGKRWTRKELEDLVVAHGGKPRSDVSGNLDFLVMADPSSKSSKAQKARKLGIEILSEKDFFARLESAT